MITKEEAVSIVYELANSNILINSKKLSELAFCLNAESGGVDVWGLSEDDAIEKYEKVFGSFG